MERITLTYAELEGLLPVRLHGILRDTDRVYKGVNGNFTSVLILTFEGVPAIGVAKRSPQDKPNTEIGLRVALARAVIDLWWSEGRVRYSRS